MKEPTISGTYEYIDGCSNGCCAESNDDGNGGGGGSSSGKDNFDSRVSARSLGNIKIESVYLGTSPNIYINMNFLVSFTRSLRKFVGKFASTSPEFIHSAIWVGRKDAKDDDVGALFVYGKYSNKDNNPSFL